MKTGLTLGKFAPLHKGHMYLIEAALKEVDELYILIYDTEVTKIPLSIRAGWLRALYPEAKVIECWDGPEGCGREREIEIIQENYIISVLNGRKIDAFYSSEFYGEHVSRALGAFDRRVDEARRAVPVSATQIRENPYRHRQYIDDSVYADLITKVVFMGAMSTGKSTITEAVAKRYNTAFASEYGRDYWAEHQKDRRIGLSEFDIIAREHIRREDAAALAADKYLFVDTNAITTYMFSLDYHGKASPYLTEIALKNSSRYDLFFLCGDEIPYDDTWDRSGDQKRQVFQKQIRANLIERRIPYIPLKGSVQERLERIDEILAGFCKYDNFFGRI